MRLVKTLFGLHVGALIFGLVGLTLVAPHIADLAGNGLVAQTYPYALQYTGSLHILFGAATMLAFGIRFLGWRKTGIFFVVATLLPLCMELLGTGTGEPFGAYSYTSNLGYKISASFAVFGYQVDGRVPFSIPLSWFYMGFTSFLLANVILSQVAIRWRTLWTVLLGAWLLTAWDLVLDPAMASEKLLFRFWTWHVHGAYFGMPIQNFAGWCLTGVIFMTVARLLWGSGVRDGQLPAWFPFAMYLANMTFAIVLSLSVGLWQPVLLALVVGLLPASLALRGRRVAPRSGAPVAAAA